MLREFTATTYVIDQSRISQRVLLLFHEKLQTWLPPGGHVEENETLCEAAIREVKEETGLDVDFFLQENIWIRQKNAKSLPRPYMMQLQDIPQYKEMPQHQHVDAIFVAHPLPGNTLTETDKMHWFTKEEVDNLLKTELFEDTKETIHHILATFCAPYAHTL